MPPGGHTNAHDRHPGRCRCYFKRDLELAQLLVQGPSAELPYQCPLITSGTKGPTKTNSMSSKQSGITVGAPGEGRRRPGRPAQPQPSCSALRRGKDVGNQGETGGVSHLYPLGMTCRLTRYPRLLCPDGTLNTIKAHMCKSVSPQPQLTLVLGELRARRELRNQLHERAAGGRLQCGSPGQRGGALRGSNEVAGNFTSPHHIPDHQIPGHLYLLPMPQGRYAAHAVKRPQNWQTCQRN